MLLFKTSAARGATTLCGTLFNGIQVWTRYYSVVMQRFELELRRVYRLNCCTASGLFNKLIQCQFGMILSAIFVDVFDYIDTLWLISKVNICASARLDYGIIYTLTRNTVDTYV